MPGVRRGETLAIAEAYLLVSRFSRRITRIAEESLGRGDVSNRDVEVLLLLRHGAESPSEIAERIGAARASVSRTLRRLRAAALVASTKDAADGRAKHVALTTVARGRMDSFADELAECIDDELPSLEVAAAHVRIAVTPVPVAGRDDAMARAQAMARAGGRYQDEVGARLGALGVTSTRPQHALALLRARGGERPARIAEELSLTSQATAALVDHLQGNGLVVRTRRSHDADRRAVDVALTPDGEHAARAMLDVFGRHLESVIQSIVTPAE